MKARLATGAVLATGGLALMHWGSTADEPTGDPLVAEPRVVTVDGARVGPKARVSFTLVNCSRRPVTLGKVRTHCDCVLASDVRGHVLPPGESFTIAFQVSPPETGVRTERADVSHDASRAPLELTIAMSGRRPPPYLLTSGPAWLTYLDLDAPPPARFLTVRTCEPSGGPPWLGDVSCDLPEVAIERARVTENPGGTAVVRTYQYRVTWGRLPDYREFRGRIVAAVRPLGAATSGQSSATVEVGVITGTRRQATTFAPACARLTAGSGWSDAVVVNDPESGDPWAVDPAWAVPPGLTWEWGRHGDRRRLCVTVAERAAGRPRGTIHIPYVSGRATAQLAVVVE